MSTTKFYAYGSWWDKEVIEASTPYAPRMTPAPQPTLKNYETIDMDLFRRMEVLGYVRKS